MNYDYNDYEFITGMYKKVIRSKQEMDEILRLYNKYVGKMVAYRIDCNCSNSILNIWIKLRDWTTKNHYLFVKD